MGEMNAWLFIHNTLCRKVSQRRGRATLCNVGTGEEGQGMTLLALFLGGGYLLC